MALEDELGAVAEAARAFLGPGEELAGVVAAEPGTGLRAYLCAYRRDGVLTWLVLMANREPVTERAIVREVASVVGLCELAEESAGGGDLPALRARLAELARSERPHGLEAAAAAAAELARVLAPGSRVASPAYLDAIGTAAVALERALGELGSSPFAAAMMAGAGAVEALASDVLRNHKLPLTRGR
ncbi:MAG: hypothetical protein IT201_04560 [Thermoleophilia bacterium]|nr:hypothetical protein [Thermoleophilia bacterium]